MTSGANTEALRRFLTHSCDKAHILYAKDEYVFPSLILSEGFIALRWRKMAIKTAQSHRRGVTMI